MFKKIFIFVCFFFVFSFNVFASEYYSNIDVSYSTTENRLFNLAINNGLKINDKLIIFRADNLTYYAIFSTDYSLNGNILIFNNAKVIKYFRYDNYNSSWYSSIYDDSSVVIHLNSYSLGNIKNSDHVFNFNDLQDFYFNNYFIFFLIFVVSILFFRCFRK